MCGVGVGVFDYNLSLWLFKEEHLSDSGERNMCIQYWLSATSEFVQ